MMTGRAFVLAAIAAFGMITASTSPLQAELGAAYGELLEKYVVADQSGINLVDYAKWKKSAADLERLSAYLAGLQTRKPSAMARDEAFVYWVNLYNAATLKLVLDNYPVKSIRDIPSTGTGLFDFKAYSGPWRTKFLEVEGNALSLDDIEHGILRPKFKDPRAHYAVNCASIGCPDLKPTPWAAASLETDLDAAARGYINHPRGVRIGRDGGVRVSSIYEWFKEDFGGSDKGILAHLSNHARPALKKTLAMKDSIAGHDYDWSLNEVKRWAVRLEIDRRLDPVGIDREVMNADVRYVMGSTLASALAMSMTMRWNAVRLRKQFSLRCRHL
jgi:hypothetical protein